MLGILSKLNMWHIESYTANIFSLSNFHRNFPCTEPRKTVTKPHQMKDKGIIFRNCL